jgi:adenylosuccinate synthase
MSSLVVIGTQFGDEGKGKIVDCLADEADLVVRFQGGANAGHTVIVGKDVFKFHLLPSGMIKGKECVIGNGVVLDPKLLLEELDGLKSRGYDTSKLRISDRAHVVMSYHKILDALEEKLKGRLKAGTTKRGIGPCYQDKAARIGIRMVDLVDPSEFKARLGIILPMKRRQIEAYGGSEEDLKSLSENELFNEYSSYGARLKEHVADTSLIVHQKIQEGKHVLFEGAQGTLLCIDHGIYPHGTSSNCISAAASAGAGIGPKHIDKVMGVVKAYTSRVGTGPFPTEIKDELGDKIREKGGEYGTTTGRPRRCGWLDLVMIKHSLRINSLDSLAITKVDVLEGLEKVKVCRAYEYEGKQLEHFPADLKVLDNCRPIYDELDGWGEFTREEYSKYSQELPGKMENLKKYLDHISNACGIPIDLMSYGPERSALVDLRK